MTISRGVFLDFDSVHPQDLDTTSIQGTLTDWKMHPATSARQVATRIAEADVVVSNKVVLDRDVLRQAPNLRLICVAATGTNNVDLEAARELGVPVTNVRAYGTPSVVQHVFALILALTTRLHEHRSAARDGSWERSPYFCILDYPIRELAGKTLGVIGYGELGRGVTGVAKAFGMEVAVAQRPGGAKQPGRVDLDVLLRVADVVSLHLPLADNTRHLIDASALALMKRDALLINTARGGIVDEQALLAALTNGALGGAGVDVLETEPPVGGNALLSADLPNLIVTPHVAWAARESRQRVLDQVAENILAFMRGEATNRVV